MELLPCRTFEKEVVKKNHVRKPTGGIRRRNYCKNDCENCYSKLCPTSYKNNKRAT